MDYFRFLTETIRRWWVLLLASFHPKTSDITKKDNFFITKLVLTWQAVCSGWNIQLQMLVQKFVTQMVTYINRKALVGHSQKFLNESLFFSSTDCFADTSTAADKHCVNLAWKSHLPGRKRTWAIPYLKRVGALRAKQQLFQLKAGTYDVRSDQTVDDRV